MFYKEVQNYLTHGLFQEWGSANLEEKHRIKSCHNLKCQTYFQICQISGEWCDRANKIQSLKWLTNEMPCLETDSLKLQDQDVKLGMCFHISYTWSIVTFIFAYFRFATETTKECKQFQD